MPDIQSLNAVVAMLTSPAPDVSATSIPAAVIALPDKLVDLTRVVQLTGTVLDLTDNAKLTLQTAAGNVTVDLLPNLLALGGGEAAKALQAQLPFLAQSQKPLTLFLQPGTPPTQALLMLPQNVAHAGMMALATQPVTPFKTAESAIGKIGKAVVLPEMGVPMQPLAAGKMPKTKPFFAMPMNELKTASYDFGPKEKQDFGTYEPPVPTPRAAPALLKPSAEVRFRFEAVLPPETQEIASPSHQAPHQIIATVAGKGTAGQLILKGEGVTLFTRQGFDLPQGSRVLMTLLPPEVDANVVLPPNPAHEAVALQKLVTALHQIDPHLAQQTVHTHVPQPNEALVGTLLFFFDSLQKTKGANWLGDSVQDRLKGSDKQDLVTKLVDELSQAGGNAYDSTVGGWKSYPLPLHDMGQFQMMHLYVHQDREPPQQRAAGIRAVEPRTRFLINLTMTRLGAMQMDGLSQKKQLDMIIRSERPLPERLPNELRGIYGRTLEALGYAGTLNFQTGRQNWLVVRREGEKAGVVT